MIDIEYYLSKLQKDTFAIFLFHGVINKATTEIRNYTNKHLLAREFDKLMKKLRTSGNSVSIDEIILNKQSNQKLPPLSYAITFDDGFENNFTVAAPILEKYSCPATFYVSTEMIMNNSMSWIDQIEFCFEKIRDVTIELPWSKNYYMLNDRNSKITCLKDIRNQVKNNPRRFKPEKIVRHIFDQCKIDMVLSSDSPLDKKMNWKQVRNLQSNKLFSVGGHSHNHISLGSLGTIEMKREIEKSVIFLKKFANIVSVHYSYPEGQENDYNDEVISTLKKKGVECCPTALNGFNDKTTDLFHLRRIMVE